MPVKDFVYSGENLSMIRFPLGGIGTGSVSLTGVGSLKDWEIFNRPNKNSVLPFTFPILHAREEGKEPVTKLAEASMPPPYDYPDGVPRETGAGLPHLRSCTFTGKYPFARIDFEDDKMPVEVSLEAYNPFIPGNPDDSGIPVAILNYTLKNKRYRKVTGTLAFSLVNPIGYPGKGPFFGWFDTTPFAGGNKSEFRKESGISGFLLSSEKYGADSPRYGTMALTTPWRDLTWQTSWHRGSWYERALFFWDEFSKDGLLTDQNFGPTPDGQTDVSVLGLRFSLEPGEEVTLPIHITWHFPNFEKYWDSPFCSCDCKCNDSKPMWKNYYATQFEDAWDAARYLNSNIGRLYNETKAFSDELFGSTFPEYVLDALSSQMSILKTTTCIRLEDGTFYGFEGCNPDTGCCEGSCTHVWNYAQTQAFLYPSLERSMREADYKYNFFEDGEMGFRLILPLGRGPQKFHPAADGQLGGVLKSYRDWKLSGDDEWLKGLWPSIKRALGYAWKVWDPDRDGIIDGIQHNTYDIEFHGANSMVGTFYLAALKAAAEMAEYLGYNDEAEEYLAVYRSGRKLLDERLFNGEYYEQEYDPAKGLKFQYGKGCLSDQVIGQWLAHIIGLGYILPQEHVKKALESVFRYNWKEDLGEHPNVQRVYALNNEKGLLLCTWPKGERPKVPFQYSYEVWCGIEYQVAAHMIYEGMIEEGLAIVKGVRERHDGVRRNPWNEFECGNHYARSMASWSLLLALSGFSFDMRRGMLGFAPAISTCDFSSFWSVSGAWGGYSQRKEKEGFKAELKVSYGSLELKELGIGFGLLEQMVANIIVYIDGKPIDAEYEAFPGGIRVLFPDGIRIEKGSRLSVLIKGD